MAGILDPSCQEAEAAGLRDNGRPKKNQENCASSTVSIPRGTTNVKYIAARLERDAQTRR
jgi:hypothetical protein